MAIRRRGRFTVGGKRKRCATTEPQGGRWLLLSARPLTTQKPAVDSLRVAHLEHATFDGIALRPTVCVRVKGSSIAQRV